MNAASFEKWFIEQLLPNIPADSTIVMDNAPYYSCKVEKVPNMKTKKGEIKKWLEEKILTSQKKELLTEVNKVKHLYDSIVLMKAKDLGFTVVRLPPYHCELNPIELVWSQVKSMSPFTTQSLRNI